MTKIAVELVSAATDEVRTLITALDRALAEGYDPDQQHGLTLDALFQPDIRFFLARLDGRAVGCGGIAFLPDCAEVKRMYVADAARGQGVAQSLLARIEVEARLAGVSVLRLETGTRQHAALKLYARAGFQACGPFGPYAGMQAWAIAESVFLEKRLAY